MAQCPVDGGRRPRLAARGEQALVTVWTPRLAIVLVAALARAQDPHTGLRASGPGRCGGREHSPGVHDRHGSHAAVSKAFIDPVFTHHAILEDELRVKRRSASPVEPRGVATVEVAYALTDALGAEVFLPYALAQPDSLRPERMLDIEAQPLKWSFLRRHDLIMTAVAGVVVPVGSAGPGTERVCRFEPQLVVDARWRSSARALATTEIGRPLSTEIDPSLNWAPGAL